MKKTINLSLIYALLAMVGGVFYREFTKLIGFEGRTTLAFVHTHLFLLGMIMMLIITLFISKFQIQRSKKISSIYDYIQYRCLFNISYVFNKRYCTS